MTKMIQETIFDLEKVKKELFDAEIKEDIDGLELKYVYLGQSINIVPSGKYYMPWSSNVTEEEAQKDQEWFEQADKELESIGAWLCSGEGDGLDMFICALAEDYTEEKSEE